MMKLLMCISLFLSLVPSLTFGATQIISGDNLLRPGSVSVSAENKKGLVAVFLSSACPCSNSHIKELHDLSKQFSDFNFVGIHSNADEPVEEAKSYFEKLALPFPIIQDTKSTIANVFHAHKTPHSFVILPDGSIVYRGGVSNSKSFENANRKFLREALEDIHNNKPVRTPEGRTLGCAIAREEEK